MADRPRAIAAEVKDRLVAGGFGAYLVGRREQSAKTTLSAAGMDDGPSPEVERTPLAKPTREQIATDVEKELAQMQHFTQVQSL